MKNKKNLSYMDSVHRDGTIWNLTMMIILLMFPVAVGLIFNALPDWKGVGLGLLATAPMYWAVGVVEVITFIPMLGAGGSYLSFVTGNISNLKLPCAINALENAKVSAKSEEGEIISTIAIAVSSIVTTVIIAIGVLLIVPLQPILSSEVLKPAFDQMLPALFGALGVALISKNWKLAVAPVILMLALFILVPALDSSMVGIMVPVGVVFTIAFSRFLYKKGLI
ncbi:MAG: hypothetical protein IJW03_01375 [Clostridia bacterium]|nr:hypothetical protein [Clostridia bacterium]